MANDTNASDDQVIVARKYLTLVSRGGWEFVRRNDVSGIVGIVAVTDEGKLLLVEQYRPPLQCSVIEIPAGLAGDVPGQEHEDLADAARRELLEETGYEAAEMLRLTEGATSAGLCDERVTLFLARGLRRTGPGAGDGSEDITVHEIPLPDVSTWLASRTAGGAALDLKVWAALYFISADATPVTR